MSGSAPGWIAGYVPTAGEWNAWWERKLDVSYGAIGEAPIDAFTYGRVSAAWAKVVPLTQLGTAVGQVPVFANFLGSGLPSLSFASRFGITRSTPSTTTDQSLVNLVRTSSHTGGAAGFVASNLLVGTTVQANVSNQEAAIVGQVFTSSYAAAECVGVWGQGIKTAGNSPVWGGISGGYDRTNGPSSALLGATIAHEFDIGGSDLDNAANGNMFGGFGLRVGLQIGAVRWNKSVDYEVSHGIWFSTHDEANTHYNSLIGTAVGVQAYQFVDSRGAVVPTGYTDPVAAVRMLHDQCIDFNGGASLKSDAGNYLQYTTTGTHRLRYMVGATERLSFPDTKPAVTGSRGGNAALASLITALAAIGLITDFTTP